MDRTHIDAMARAGRMVSAVMTGKGMAGLGRFVPLLCPATVDEGLGRAKRQANSGPLRQDLLIDRQMSTGQAHD